MCHYVAHPLKIPRFVTKESLQQHDLQFSTSQGIHKVLQCARLYSVQPIYLHRAALIVRWHQSTDGFMLRLHRSPPAEFILRASFQTAQALNN